MKHLLGLTNVPVKMLIFVLKCLDFVLKCSILAFVLNILDLAARELPRDVVRLSF